MFLLTDMSRSGKMYAFDQKVNRWSNQPGGIRFGGIAALK